MQPNASFFLPLTVSEIYIFDEAAKVFNLNWFFSRFVTF
jgi:hypothetical protein